MINYIYNIYSKGAINEMNDFNFEKNIEKMIKPIDVGTIHFIQSYSKLMSPKLQYKLMSKGAKKNPYMGFVVEPYSFFLCYTLKDLEWAKRLIPDDYKLIKTKIFENDEPNYYCIFGSFNVHSSAFWGTRMEFYIIAENTKTGLLSWLIIDYDTNTVSFDKMNGLSGGNTNTCVLTTNYDGEIVVDIRNDKKRRNLVLSGKINRGKEEKLHQRLWLEGNLSVGYGKEISGNRAETFGMIFSHKEVERANRILNKDINIQENTWYDGLFDKEPKNIVCFPFAQHYLSDSPGYFSNIMNKQQLSDAVTNIDFDTIPSYSSSAIKKSFKIGQIISVLIIIVLLILLAV